jgi:hypothetical protein
MLMGNPQNPLKTMVGMTGFEPATSWSRTKRSTKLSHIPNISHFNLGNHTCQQKKRDRGRFFDTLELSPLDPFIC